MRFVPCCLAKAALHWSWMKSKHPVSPILKDQRGVTYHSVGYRATDILNFATSLTRTSTPPVTRELARRFPECPSQEGVRLSHTCNNKLCMKSAKTEIQVITTFLTILHTVSVTVWKNITKMQKLRQPSCRLTGFLFYQFLNYILLFRRDPVRRVSSQSNGVLRHVPFFSRHTHAEHY